MNGKLLHRRFRNVIFGFVLACAASSCGGSSNYRAEALNNLKESAGSQATQIAPCLSTLVNTFSQPELKVAVHGGEGWKALTDRMEAGFKACQSSAGPASAPDLSSISDPDLRALVTDAKAWMQAKWDTVSRALCDNRPELLDAVYTEDSTDLAPIRASAGQKCPTVIVLSVTTRSGGTALKDFWLTEGKEIQFYVTDSGWSGPNHQWSAHFVSEGGAWKLHSST